MSKFKKMLALLLVAVVTAGISIGGTVAYLQDSDSDVNVMTLGQVGVELIEQQRTDDRNGLEPFEQNKPMYPMVGAANIPDKWGIINAENYVDKIVTAKLDADSSDAYVRILVAIPAALEDNINGTNALDWYYGNLFDKEGKGSYNYTSMSKIWSDQLYNYKTNNPYFSKATGVEINGDAYNVYNFTVKQRLTAGDETAAPIVGMYLHKGVNYDNDRNKYYMELNGTKSYIDYAPLNENGTVKIPVIVQAVQAEGWEAPSTNTYVADFALNTAFGEVNNNNKTEVATWFPVN